MSLPDSQQAGSAVITGASSGIGEALAGALAARGYSLVLVARRQAKLEAIAARLQGEHGVEVEVLPTDLSDAAARKVLCEELAARPIAVLCNNAGLANWGQVSELDPEQERLQVELNTVAVHALTLAVLPGMLARGQGAIELTGSIAGMQPMPGCATYAATKAFVNSFGESLHQELKGSGVSCTVLAPGPVTTELTAASGINGIDGAGGEMVWLSAQRVAEETVAAMDRGQRLIVPGVFAKANALTGRLAPHRMLLPLVQQVSRRVVRMGRDTH